MDRVLLYLKKKTNHWKEVKPEKRTTNTLDNLFPDSTFEIIKIDTQGSEIPILKGGKRTSSKSRSRTARITVLL